MTAELFAPTTAALTPLGKGVYGAAGALLAAKEAVAYGLGWQSVFGEYTKKHIGDG